MWHSLPRPFTTLGIALALCLVGSVQPALASPGLAPNAPVSSLKTEIGKANPGAIARLGIGDTPSLRFAVGSGSYMRVASQVYDRAQVSPLVGLFDSLPHGEELTKLKLYVATDEEIAQTCGAGTMACYDPSSERMIVSGQSEEVDGIPREAVIAHEYGHHIANNRRGGIWSALTEGTARWSTYEHVCELTRDGQAFPGDEGAHYWENPGEAFAQSYSQMVVPQANWYYSPLLRPDETALAKLRMDVLHPWPGPHQEVWRRAAVGASADGIGVGAGVALSGPATTAAGFRRQIDAPLDGRLTVRLRAATGARYSLALVDPATESVVATSSGSGSVARLHYADCGQRSLVLKAIPAGEAGSFEAKISVP